MMVLENKIVINAKKLLPAYSTPSNISTAIKAQTVLWLLPVAIYGHSSLSPTFKLSSRTLCLNCFRLGNNTLERKTTEPDLLFNRKFGNLTVYSRLLNHLWFYTTASLNF